MAGGMVMRWYGPQVQQAVERAMFAGILKAAAWLKRQIVASISTSGRASGGGARSPVAGGKPPMKVYHSRPGQPPFTDTGKLRQSIFMDQDRGESAAVVGTTSKIGVYLEKGVTGGVAISPTRKKCLVFPGWVEKAASGKKGARSAWDWVFVKQVTQGPISPRPFLVPGLNLNSHQIASIALNEAAARLQSQGIGSVLQGQTIQMGAQIGQ